ncbi:MAG: hypothetical protein IT306_12200 [Chloroflexi bacterium]|nr:hypothetical protein [Chloroflexota bacterium]
MLFISGQTRLDVPPSHAVAALMRLSDIDAFHRMFDVLMIAASWHEVLAAGDIETHQDDGPVGP